MRIFTAAAIVLGLTTGAATAQTAIHSATMHTQSSTAAMATTPAAGAHGNAAVKDPTIKTGMAAAGANSFTEGQARDRISKAGYAKVSSLAKTADGLWAGKAMKGRKHVSVSLDFKGNVTSN